jgi:hypothetical protein
MQSGNPFNANTIDWQKPDIRIDTSQLPDIDTDPDDIRVFQRDGVVLLRGLCVDWVDTLRAGLQRNLENP